MSEKVVITYGTFDLFHVGHVRLLQRLRNLGDRLIVGLSSDEFNALKGKKAVIPFESRKEILESCRYVDKVIREDNWEQKRTDILNEKAHIFAMGDDWVGKFDELSDICEVVYLSRTEGISTTELKNYLQTLNDANRNSVKQMIERLYLESQKSL